MREQGPTAIPNALTLAGLGLGAAAGGSMVTGDLQIGIALWWMGALMDNIDGPVARRLGASSERGGILDALGDLVLYGVAPYLLLAGLGLGVAGLVVLTTAAWRLSGDLLSDAKGVHFGVPAALLIGGAAWTTFPGWALVLWAVLSGLWFVFVPAIPSLRVRLALAVWGVAAFIRVAGELSWP